MLQAHMKDYMKAIKAKLTEKGKSEEEIKAWQDEASKTVVRLAKNVGECDVFLGMLSYYLS